MSGKILKNEPVVWAEGNAGASAALRQRLVNPNRTYPVLHGTGVAIKFLMRALAADGITLTPGTPKINYAVGDTIDPVAINPDTGKAYGEGWVSYSPLPLDTDTPGTYVYRWVVEVAADDLLSYPNDSWIRLNVCTEAGDPAP